MFKNYTNEEKRYLLRLIKELSIGKENNITPEEEAILLDEVINSFPFSEKYKGEIKERFKGKNQKVLEIYRKKLIKEINE